MFRWVILVSYIYIYISIYLHGFSYIFGSIQDIKGVLNVQHDCHKSKCKVEKVRPILIERRVLKALEFAVVHQATKNFILNSGAFYSAKIHREAGQSASEQANLSEWTHVVQVGLANWEDTVQKKDEQIDKRRQKAKNKLLANPNGWSAPKRSRIQRKQGLQSPPQPGPSNSQLIATYLSRPRPRELTW